MVLQRKGIDLQATHQVVQVNRCSAIRAKAQPSKDIQKGRGQQHTVCAGKATRFTLPTVENPYNLLYQRVLNTFLQSDRPPANAISAVGAARSI